MKRPYSTVDLKCDVAGESAWQAVGRRVLSLLADINLL